MSREERNKIILNAIKIETTRVVASKRLAREFLMREGIYTVSGKLSAEYGGKPATKVARKA